MESIHSSLTVFFESPFWVGVYECQWEHHYEVGKLTFGGEPKDSEIYEEVLKGCNRLRLSSSLSSSVQEQRHINPKRMQREIKKQTKTRGIGTKAQQALKAQHEENKVEHKVRSRQEKEEEKERQFELRQEKRKQKHKGH